MNKIFGKKLISRPVYINGVINAPFIKTLNGVERFIYPRKKINSHLVISNIVIRVIEKRLKGIKNKAFLKMFVQESKDGYIYTLILSDTTAKKMTGSITFGGRPLFLLYARLFTEEKGSWYWKGKTLWNVTKPYKTLEADLETN